MLEDNISLKELNLSHNEFREEGGVLLAAAIGLYHILTVINKTSFTTVSSLLTLVISV